MKNKLLLFFKHRYGVYHDRTAASVSYTHLTLPTIA